MTAGFGSSTLSGKDIGAAVIAAGHALDCRYFSGGRYRRHLETPAARSRIKPAGCCDCVNVFRQEEGQRCRFPNRADLQSCAAASRSALGSW
jgi:hypothetical protein